MTKKIAFGVFAAIAAVALSSCSSQMYTLKSSNSKTVIDLPPKSVPPIEGKTLAVKN